MARRLVDNRPFDAALPPAPQARWYTNLSTALLILMQARPSAECALLPSPVRRRPAAGNNSVEGGQRFLGEWALCRS